MSEYDSTNTTILETHTIENKEHPNTRMLLLHECDSGRLEYVIGSYFTIEVELGDPYDKNGPAFVGHYSWDWGHYFGSVVDAVDYWKNDVLGIDPDGFDVCG